MLKFFISTIALCTYLFLPSLVDDNKFTQAGKDTRIVLDSMNNRISILYNNHGLPTYYYSDIFTTVCSSSECLPIRIEIRWDLDGNFHSYTLTNNEILTKVDHIPFTPADYDHLDRILRDTLSDIKNYTVHSLEASEKGQKEVHGVSGATSMMTAGTYVPGALYTSVKLWHLVHDVKPTLKAYTRHNLLNDHDSKALALRTDIGGSVIALEKLLQTQNKPNDYLLKEISHFDSDLLAKTILHLNSGGFDNEIIAPGLLNHYNKVDDKTKVLIENFWRFHGINDAFLTTLVNTCRKSMSYTDITISMLELHDEWNNELCETVIDYIENERNMNRRNRMKKVFMSKQKNHPKQIKKRLKELGW